MSSRGFARLAARAGATTLAAVALVTFAAQAQPRPMVLFMDSKHPSRVYDSTTMARNGTNADVLAELLGGLPIRPRTETISPAWNRAADVRLAAPDLIVIHWSGFCDATCTDRSPLRRLVEAMPARTKFIVYSRMAEDSLRMRVDSLLRDVDRAQPGTMKRVDVFGLDSHGSPHWRDTTTAGALTKRVRDVLKLP